MRHTKGIGCDRLFGNQSSFFILNTNIERFVVYCSSLGIKSQHSCVQGLFGLVDVLVCVEQQVAGRAELYRPFNRASDQSALYSNREISVVCMHFARHRKPQRGVSCRISDHLGADLLILRVIFVPSQIPMNFDPWERLAIVILDVDLHSIRSPWSGDAARGCSQYEWICRGSVKGLDSRRDYFSALRCDFILQSKPMQGFHFRGRHFLERPFDLEHQLLLTAYEFDRL